MNLGSCSLAYAELLPFFSYEDKTPPNYVVCSNTFVKFRCKKLVKKKGIGAYNLEVKMIKVYIIYIYFSSECNIRQGENIGSQNPM